MPRQEPLYAWTDQVITAFPNLSRPQATVLALYSFGMIPAQRCGLTCVVTALVPLLGVGFLTLRSHHQEFSQPAPAKSGVRRQALDVTTCFAPLLAGTLRGWPSTRLALALDATSLGDRFTVLSISVVYRGSALPVAWKILPANVARPWKPEWLALLDAFSVSVPSGWTVVVMTDRGLDARWLYRALVARGWHPLMRITRCGKFRKAGGQRGVPVGRFVPEAGRRWQGRGTAFPTKPERRLECTLLACWEAGQDEPWLLLTDLAPEQAESLWYGMRAWIEHGFKLLKSTGWQWQATRMTDCGRAERLWLVLAVATRYVLAVGGEFEAGQEVPVATLPASARDAVPRGSAAASRPGTEVRAGDASPPVFGDERAAGQRVPPRAFGVAGPSDHRSCVAQTPMETGAVVGTSSRNPDIRRTTPDTDPEKPLPLSRGQSHPPARVSSARPPSSGHGAARPPPRPGGFPAPARAQCSSRHCSGQ